VTTARRTQQTLLFDADDTLWENNIYFEEAIASFISFLDHQIHSPAEVRERLNACERATIGEHGYGVESFRKSLAACFEQLSEAPASAKQHRQIVSFTEAIASSAINLLPAVASTLSELSRRHRCLLVTKGNVSEQVGKLERSGLKDYFVAVEVLAEKDEAAYLHLIVKHDLLASETWMIGNSPRSDINPSLAAGLNAIFIPHDSTWVLEHEVVDIPQRGRELMELSQFEDLLRLF
jgi:putative hydrolase of the HAD superfamily